MSAGQLILANITAVAIDGRAVLIEGASGSGKSSLALALIERGALLIGDDAVTLERRRDELFANPPPNIAGKLEIRGVGLVDMPTTSAPLALAIALDETAERMPLALPARSFLGCDIPLLGMAGTERHDRHLRTEWALRLHGVPVGILGSEPARDHGK